jgi:5-methyltetrahydrofolate--homocysteine methyltransferase
VKSRLLEALDDNVLVYDGAMGTQLQAAQLTADDFVLPERGSAAVLEARSRLGAVPLEGCNELLNLTRPDVVEKIHRAYFEAGSDLVETNTFGATSIVLADYNIPGLVYDLSKAAAQIARKAADSMPGRPRFVVGALGPGTKLISLGQTHWREVEGTYSEGFRALLEGGADALLLETMQDLLLVKAGIVAANRAMAETERQVPLFVQVTMEQTGTMLLGTELAAALNCVEAFPSVVAFGLNCATGPTEMAPHVRFLGQNSTRPIAVQPNAGLPMMENGKALYKLSPNELAEFQTRFVDSYGAALVGGCCGTTPAHIKSVAEALGGTKHRADAHWRKTKPLFPGFDFEIKTDEQAAGLKLVGCSSLYQFQPYEQDKSFLIIGEKTNANGSKAFREMLAEENWEALTELARELEGEGSHVLDVCTAYVGRNEARDMATLLSYYNRHVTVPLMLDSTEWPVIEVSLQTVAGKPIVNSINFEDGGPRAEKVLSLCQKYGAAVVALTIDEDGMAKTTEKKVAIADRLLAETRRHGLPDHDVFIDALTFTLGSGDEEFRGAGITTIEAIAEIKRKHPRVNTTLGVSNVSFGLRPPIRQVLNSAFLHEARLAGLTSAIVHFSKILPENQIESEVWTLAMDLIHDRRRYGT